jgi:bifunctional non-homologous end joining protein LigD
VHFYAFDLLHVDGRALVSKPLSERRARLQRVMEACPDVVRFSAALDGDVDHLLKKARALGLEGLIGKRGGSRYEPGRRTGSWIKLKLTTEQEFVIGGYTRPAGGRSHFGALLLGVYSGRRLSFVGRVGTGFDGETLAVVHQRLTRLERRTSPFEDFPAGESAASLRGMRWVAPKLVCQVRFTEWTRAGRLRHPVFLGLRDDKAAREVVREGARPIPHERHA